MSMTIETRTTIEPNDVVAVEVLCKGCGCSTSTPLGRWRIEPSGCGNCGAKWGFVESDFRQLSQLISLLRSFGSTQAAETLPFKLRFEIAQPRKESL